MRSERIVLPFIVLGLIAGLLLPLTATAKVTVGPSRKSARLSETETNRETRQLLSLKNGDFLNFSDGSRFQIDKVLGYGGTTIIFALQHEPDLALRVPINSNRIGMIRAFVEGYEALRRDGVSTVEILEVSPDFEYAIVERLPSRLYSLAEFVSGKNLRGLNYNPENLNAYGRFFVPPILAFASLMHGERPSISTKMRAEMRQAFIEFSHQARHFAKIGDFKFEQIAYDADNKRWVLFDWSDGHIQYVSGKGENLFLYQLESQLGAEMGFQRAKISTPQSQFIQDLLEEIRNTDSQLSPVGRCDLLFVSS